MKTNALNPHFLNSQFANARRFPRLAEPSRAAGVVEMVAFGLFALCTVASLGFCARESITLSRGDSLERFVASALRPVVVERVADAAPTPVAPRKNTPRYL